MAVDHRIALLARRQHDPVHHEQLLALGLSDDQIEHRLKTKRLFRVQPRVYTIGLRDLTELGSWSAAVLASGDQAALAIRSAGCFHRILNRYRGPIEVLTTKRKRITLDDVRIRQTTFGPFDVIAPSDIRVTSLPRTLLDLAGVLTPDELSHPFQTAMRLGLRLPHVDDVIARNPRAKRFTIQRNASSASASS